MTPKERAAMQQALEALEMFAKHYSDGNEAITALREALAAEPKLTEDNISYHKLEQEPVYAFRRKGLDSFCTCDKQRYEELADKPNLFEVTTFYAAPVRTKDLTDDEIRDAVSHPMTMMKLNDARAVIAKLKEKTNG